MSDPLAEMAERLEEILEELSDMALDALSRASSGDPDSTETGEALAAERRILKARRAMERAIVALRERPRSRASVDEGAD